jgi:hypothetical protein
LIRASFVWGADLPKGEGRKLEDDEGLLRAAAALAWKDDEAAN